MAPDDMGQIVKFEDGQNKQGIIVHGDIEITIEDLSDLEASSNDSLFQTISLNTAFIEENFIRMHFETDDLTDENGNALDSKD